MQMSLHPFGHQERPQLTFHMCQPRHWHDTPPPLICRHHHPWGSSRGSEWWPQICGQTRSSGCEFWNGGQGDNHPPTLPHTVWNFIFNSDICLWIAKQQIERYIITLRNSFKEEKRNSFKEERRNKEWSSTDFLSACLKFYLSIHFFRVVQRCSTKTFVSVNFDRRDKKENW